MKILVLANFGMGLYNFRKELLQKLVKDKNKVFISLPNDEYVPLLKDLGCEYIESKVDRRGTNPFSDFKLLLSYVKIIKKVKPDIVLTYTIKPNIYGGIACQITRTPYLPNVTGLGTAIEEEGLMKELTLGLYKVGLKKADCVFFQNKPNEQFFTDKGIVKINTQVLPGSGVNLEEHKFEEYPEDDGTIRLLFIGRIMKAKGVDELLEVAETIKNKFSNIEFTLVGFCEEGYAEKLKELNDKGIIRYHGQQSNIHKYIKNAHATILPSYHEGTSNVLLETASTGRPVLASNITGCKETFDEGSTGLGFESRNIESLLKTITTFIILPYNQKKEMGKAGRIKMEKEFDRNLVINEYMKWIKVKE